MRQPHGGHGRTRPFILGMIGAITGASCGTVLGSRHASKPERAKIEQRVGPINERGVPLRAALQAIVDAAPLPVTIEVCSSVEDTPVTIVTTTSQELGVLVAGAAMQVGAPFRLFIGHHGEAGRPTLYCVKPGGTLTSVEKALRGARAP